MSYSADCISSFPEVVQEHIMSFLDIKSLFNCCRVNKKWNDFVNLSPMVWLRACKRFGLIARENEGIRDKKYWKSYVLSILKRKRQMKDGTCFVVREFNYTERVYATYSNNGKIALGLENKVEIWNCTPQIHELSIMTGVFPQSLKFDNNILMAGYFRGVTSWNIELRNRIAAYTSRNHLISFDFLSENDLVVASYGDCIGVFKLSTGCRVGSIEKRTFYRLKLASKLIEERNQQVYVFIVYKDTISVGNISFCNGRVCKRDFNFNVLYDIPLEPETLLNQMHCNINIIYDGKFLYFPKSSVINPADVICKWNVQEEHLVTEMHLRTKFQNILGIGEKYVVVQTVLGNSPDGIIMGIDKETKEMAAFCDAALSVRSGGGIDNDAIVLCNTSWLDGLNGENDHGILHACIVDCMAIYVAVWTPRQ